MYRALNLNTGQMVAVKRIRLEGLKEEEIAQLMKEVDLVKSLSHPSIVKYEGMARDDDTLSIVLEYVLRAPRLACSYVLLGMPRTVLSDRLSRPSVSSTNGSWRITSSRFLRDCTISIRMMLSTAI